MPNSINLNFDTQNAARKITISSEQFLAPWFEAVTFPFGGYKPLCLVNKQTSTRKLCPPFWAFYLYGYSPQQCAVGTVGSILIASMSSAHILTWLQCLLRGNDQINKYCSNRYAHNRSTVESRPIYAFMTIRVLLKKTLIMGLMRLDDNMDLL
jgi:hypothetical protein